MLFMFEHKGGLVFKDLIIDPHRSPKQDKVIFTHAHSDHVKLNAKSNFFSTPETRALIKNRFSKSDKHKFEEIPFGSKKQFNGCEVVLRPNGHILGSAQAEIISDGTTNAVTSDFRLKDSLFFKGAEPIKADTLVVETTFGDPKYVFPNQDDVVSEMVSWIEASAKSGLVVLGGYSLGKAQELTYIANQAGFTPLVHEKIFELNKIYNQFGTNVGKYEKLDHNLKDFSVLIMPPQLVDRHLMAVLDNFDKRKVFSAMATGWEFRGMFNKTFPLSNHADFNDLVEYVKLSDPKLVLTDHGFCESFARKLNRLGFNAKPLQQHNQRILGEY